MATVGLFIDCPKGRPSCESAAKAGLAAFNARVEDLNGGSSNPVYLVTEAVCPECNQRIKVEGTRPGVTVLELLASLKDRSRK